MRSRDASLAGGKAGLALFFAYLARSRPGQGHERTAARFLDGAVEAVARQSMRVGLYSGFTGIAFVVTHLQPLLDPDGADRNGDLDEALAAVVERSPWTGEYDLIEGLVGIGVYAVERLPRPTAAKCLKRVVDRLAELEKGGAWPSRTEEVPREHFNLGVAHGTPGVVGMLGAALAAGAKIAKARPLASRAGVWLSSQLVDRRKIFPYWIVPGELPTKLARTAWCYGDPGIAATLLSAAQSLRSRRLEMFARQQARAATARRADESGVVDAGLCHGAAGVGHLFNRIHQSTGDVKCARAARFWLARTLQMRRPGRGVAGFAAVNYRDGKPVREASAGWLMGAAGIGLALLAATNDVDPEWDRLLLASNRSA